MTRALLAARLALLAPLACALLSCQPGPATYPLQVIETATFARSLGVDLAASTKQPSGVYYRDTTLGTGAAVAAGSVIDAHYVGSLIDGSVFDQNVGSDTPLHIQYGVGHLIPGFDKGLTGVKVGGTRQLVIPPAQGYGADGSPPKVPGNAILIFSVTITAVQ